MSDVAFVRPAPGPSFAAGDQPRRRARIGGASGGGPGDAAALAETLRRCLGPKAAVLAPDRPLVVDADGCHLGGRPLTTAQDWWPVVLDDQLGQVEGAFALGWLAPDGALCLARDAVGHRSLYYAVPAGRLLFASSLRALLETGAVPRRLQPRSIATYLSYAYVPGRQTLVQGAFEVLPGEEIRFDGGGLQRRSFWSLPREPEGEASEPALQQALRAALESTVQSMLPAGEPVGASLSGGVDSSLVVALAERAHPAPVHTFSITFGREYRDELPWSSLVAAHCGTRHTIVELTAATVLAHLDDTIACLDKPNGDPLTVPNALLFRAMAEHATVILNGEGGDPCFGGPKNLPMVLSEIYGSHAADGGGDGRAAGRARERSYLRAHLKCFDDLGEMLSPEALAIACAPPLEDDLAPWFEDPRWASLVARLMAINVRFKGGHHILPKIDALSAPFGVRARSPLFAKSIVELASAIPPQLKLRGADEKYLLKRAVADLLPATILDRPKSGMMVPVEAWFQGPLLAQARARILDGLAPYAIFRRKYLEDLLDGKLGGLRPRRGVKIWLLITLESHLRALGLERAGLLGDAP